MSGARGRRVRWGQNFLADRNVARRIVDWSGPDGRRVLEIGPGKGALTDLLLERCSHLTLIEIDPALAAAWRERAQGLDRLDVVEGDLLNLDLRAELARPATAATPTLVVGNLPYDAGTAIVMRLLEYRDLFDEIVVMLQKEVCERLSAAAGTRAYGLLAVHAQLRADIEGGFGVAPGSFRPRPRVHSQVIRLSPLAELRHAVGDEEVFSWLVREAFGQRRKMVRNTLGARLDERLGATAGAALLARAAIDADSRPEAVPLERFAALARLVAFELEDRAGAS